MQRFRTHTNKHADAQMQTHAFCPICDSRSKTDRQTNTENKQSVLLVEEQFPTKNSNEERGSSQSWTLINRTAVEEFSLLIVSQHALQRPELPDFLQRRAD